MCAKSNAFVLLPSFGIPLLPSIFLYPCGFEYVKFNFYLSSAPTRHNIRNRWSSLGARCTGNPMECGLPPVKAVFNLRFYLLWLSRDHPVTPCTRHLFPLVSTSTLEQAPGWTQPSRLKRPHSTCPVGRTWHLLTQQPCNIIYPFPPVPYLLSLRNVLTLPCSSCT